MIISKPKTFAHIMKSLSIILGFGLALINIIFLKALINDFEFSAIIGVFLISLISFLAIYGGSKSMKDIVIYPNEGIIVVKYMFFKDTSLNDNEIKGYNNCEIHTKLSSYDGIVVELKNGKQLVISDIDIENYKDIKDAITSFLPLKKKLELSNLRPYNSL